MPYGTVNRLRRLVILGIFGQCTAGLVACDRGSPFGAGRDDPSKWPPQLPQPAVKFPLRVETGKRYLADATGQPFLIHGDTAWSIIAQLTDAEIDIYLNDRLAKGVTAILFSAPEAFYTSQRPKYKNVDGVAPFSPMTIFSSPNDAYWRRVDHTVIGAKARGMVCIINPAYLGYPGGADGWAAAVRRASTSELLAYGECLAHRYTHGNVIWCLGGDFDGDDALIEKQWNIAKGIRSVRATDIITAHPLADKVNADDAYTYWKGYEGFNCNAIYGNENAGFYVYSLAAQAYARQGPMPFIGFEFAYENEGDATVERLRRQSYGSILSGACGQIFGNNPIWHFESPQRLSSYPGTWESNLDSVGSIQQQYVKALFSAFDWWKLVPRLDPSLITSDLGSGATRLYPAVASDRSFAMVYVPRRQNVSIDMSCLSPRQVRTRLYDPSRGTYASVAGSPFVNSGPANIRTDGERVIVLDAAPCL